jgi:hypothetical protein
MAATVLGIQETAPEVREQRRYHIWNRDRQQRLAQAVADVDAAQKVYDDARLAKVERTALDAAKARLEAIEAEAIGPQ